MSATAEPQSMATTSTFEVLGPIMVGPSSSHTAGALRCSQVARSLMPEPIVRVRFTLWNSFAHTYRGHGTDRALVGGILGYETDDPRIRNSFDHAKEAGVVYEFVIAGDDKTIHPNTVDITIVGAGGLNLDVRGESLGGAKIRISRINGVDVELSGTYPTLFVAHRDVPGALASMTSCMAQRQTNIAFLRTYRPDTSGKAYSIFETDGKIPDETVDAIRAIDIVLSATVIELPGVSASPGVSKRDYFDDGAQLLKAAMERNMSLGELVEKREKTFFGSNAADPSMQRLVNALRTEVTDPLNNPIKSLGGFLGGQARQLDQSGAAYAPHLMGTTQSKACAYAMAVLERSAAMGVIVAAPTAGSAGVVPGCVLSVADSAGASYEQVAHALYCAAGVGICIMNGAFVAGAEGGCQAEVGSAAAMAAAALVELLGGTPQQALHASSIALSNLLGLVCDPVGGLVEIPCQMRNVIGVSAAFSAAQAALAGLTFHIPFDEVVHAMAEVGRAMPTTLKETATGGLATTPTACSLCSGCLGASEDLPD